MAERKQVTILFADVTRSVGLSASVGAEAWWSVIGGLFNLLRTGVKRFGGSVDRFTGDGIMAVFGAPVAHEDHASRACHAALWLRQELAVHTAALRAVHGIGVSVRMGLHSGEVVVGTLGDMESPEYAAIGHDAGVAQRMESLAVPGSIVLSEATAELVEDLFELADLGDFEVEGASGPMRVMELIGHGSWRTLFDVARARGLTSLVGRDEELERLEAARLRSAAGAGQVVGVQGEPGVGKSRLCHEFAERCRARGLGVWRAHALSHLKSVSFAPLLEILREFLGTSEGDDERTVREQVAARLEALGEDFAADLPLLFEFLGVADPEHPGPRIDPEARRRQLFDALVRMVRARTLQSPGLILVEDLHWLDTGSEAFLSQLIEAIGEIPGGLIVATFRSGYEASWMSLPGYERIALAPLGASDSAALVGDLLGPDPSLTDVAKLVGRRAGGNPFFIEESVKALAEHGSLTGQARAYQLTSPIGEVRIPRNVESVLSARIDRLAPRQKQVLRTAAVIGRRFTVRLLRRVVELPEGELEEALGALIAAELLFTAAGEPSREYAFKHALTEEVAYRSLLAAPRRELHRAVAEAVADVYSDSLDERAALISHHWQRAGDSFAAAMWSARAAAWAGFNDPFEAARQWRAVMALSDSLPESDQQRALALSSRAMLLNFAWRLGVGDGQTAEEFELETERVYADARALAERAGDLAQQAVFIGVFAGVRPRGPMDRDRLETDLDLAMRAVELAERVREPALEVSVRMMATYALWLLGRYEQGHEVGRHGIAIAAENPTLGAGVPVTSPYAFIHLIQASIDGYAGRLSEGLRGLDEARRIAREQGDFEVECYSHALAVQTIELAGEEPRLALHHAERGLRIAEQKGGAFMRSVARAAFGAALALNERWPEAEAALAEALTAFRERRVALEFEPLALRHLSTVLLHAGDARAARTAAREAVAISLQRRTSGWELMSRIALAQAIRGCEGPSGVEAVERELRRALTLAGTTGARSLEPHVRVELAAVARMRGDDAGWARERAAARELFSAIGARRLSEALAPAA